MAKRYKPRRDAVGRSNLRPGTRPGGLKTKKETKARIRQTKIKDMDYAKIRPPEKEVEEPESLRVERFDKAFIISLALIALLTLLIFIPLIGPLMVLTLVPYIACNRGCRYVSRRNGVQVGILIGAIWSIIEIYILFNILAMVSISVTEPAIKTSLDVLILVLIFCANLIFCMVGGYTGGAKFELGETKKASLPSTEPETT
jgi:hypothetical protein